MSLPVLKFLNMIPWNRGWRYTLYFKENAHITYNIALLLAVTQMLLATYNDKYFIADKSKICNFPILKLLIKQRIYMPIFHGNLRWSCIYFQKFTVLT